MRRSLLAISSGSLSHAAPALSWKSTPASRPSRCASMSQDVHTSTCRCFRCWVSCRGGRALDPPMIRTIGAGGTERLAMGAGTVLLFEDDPPTSDVLADTLNDAGYDIRV